MTTTKEERREIYAALAAPFPESCIQRTDGRTTGRGYDTAGIAYQHVVNRLNEVLGLGGFWVAERTISVREVSTTKGRPAFEALCELRLQLGEWIGGQFVAFAEAIADGGHTALTEADAKKGSHSNAFKKAAAFVAGVGRQAYEGTLDDDNHPGENAKSSRQGTGAEPSNENDDRGSRGESKWPTGNNGRVTVAQLAKLQELVVELDSDWQSFRKWVRTERGTNPEYCTRSVGSDLIENLIQRLRRKRSSLNGAGPHDAVSGRQP